MKENLTIEVSEAMSKGLSDRADRVELHITDVVRMILANSRILIELTVNELKGVFTPEEWKFIALRLDEKALYTVLDEGDENVYSLQLMLIKDLYDDAHDFHQDHWTPMEVRLFKKILDLTSAQVYAVYYRLEELNTTMNGIEEWSHF